MQPFSGGGYWGTTSMVSGSELIFEVQYMATARIGIHRHFGCLGALNSLQVR